MKVVYIEANAEELKIRPTAMSALCDAIEAITIAIGGSGYRAEQEEDGEDADD